MRRVRRIKINNKLQKLILFSAIVVLSFLSLGYAVLSGNLDILGTLFASPYSKPVIRSFTSNGKEAFHADEYSSKITTINLSNTISEPANVVQSWNLGVNGRDNVKGYLTSDDGNTTYTLHIQGDGELIANPDSTHLFGKLTNLETINNLNMLDTSRVTNMTSMFSGCSGLTNLDLSNFDTSNVTSMSSMFAGCSGLTSLDLNNFNTSKVTTMNAMFQSCDSLTSLDLSGFNTTGVNIMSYMFSGCSSLASLDVSRFSTSNVTSMSYMFSGCSGLTSLDLKNFTTGNVTDMRYMFYGCGLTSLDLSSFNTTNVTNMSWMFSNCNGLTSLDLSNFNTGNVTNMADMFSGCSGLTSLDLSKFDTGKVTTMNAMFKNCSSLANLDLSSFNTTKVTDMEYMFSGCKGLTSLDLSDFNTTGVTTMSFMFSNCTSLTSLNLSGFNTAEVISMNSMFSSCSGLVSLDVSNFNTSSVTDISYMFNGCKSLSSLNVNSFDTSNVTNMSCMFSNCASLTSLDLSGFSTSNVTSMFYMFNGCKSLITIYVGDGWSVAKVTSSTNMFKNCTNLVGAVAFNSANIDVTMANYTTGYLTPPPICRRATTLHTETCNSEAGTGCLAAGTAQGAEITYGNLGIAGAILTAGDAFDCDVNGDGIFSAETERFYYVSDLDTNREYAVLAYYNNVAVGAPSNTATFAYDSANTPRVNGPKTAIAQLPTTAQWKKVSLVSTTRVIKDEIGVTHNADFSYAGKAARLLTYQEVNTACNNALGTDGGSRGVLDSCKYLMENTYYSDNSLNQNGYWLETIYSADESSAWYVNAYRRDVSNNYASSGDYIGVRPAIEVPKSKIAS